MAGGEGDPLDEKGHYFDFMAFYKKVEFSDRVIRLEILDESRKGVGAPGTPFASPTEEPCPPFASPSEAESSSDMEEIPVNSIVVAAKSRVLRTMLSSGMKESEKGVPLIVKVSKEEKEAFKEMLYFIYAGSLSPRFGDPSTDSREHVALLALADKFEVPSFMSAVIDCLSKLERSASRTVSDSVALVCALSGVFERRPKARRLADEARAHVVQGFRDVSATWASPEFLSLELGAVEILMQAEELEAESEEEIFERLLGWVRERYSGMEERKAVMTRLLPSVRFHCMRGEFLEKLLTYAELGSTEAAQMIERAFRFIAYSDDKKQEMIEVPGQRKGVQDVHLEINGVFSLTDTDELSGSVEWLGAAWYLQVEVSKNGEDQRHDVTLSLMCEEVIKHPSSTDSWSMDVEFSFYVKTWPNRYWKLLHKDRQKFTFTYDVHEVPNALSILYDETKKPTSTLTGGTGAITVKVVARRLSKACDPKV